MPKLHFHLFNKKISAFHFYGIAGYLLGLSTGLLIAYYTGLSVFTILLTALVSAATFFFLAFAAKVLTGKETLVYYHHEIAILAFNAIFLYSIGQPVLPYLDLIILGIAIFLAFGRIGCFSVGCCHGIPIKKGVIYGKAHVEAGFTPHYHNVPLLPVQLIESAFVGFTSLIGVLLLVMQYEAGTFLLVYTIIYGNFRFGIEFFRGDPERPYWKGFSEAQWTTLLLFLLSIVLIYIGWLPFYTWHIYLVVALMVFMLGLSIYRQRQAVLNYQIKSPYHIAELAKGLQQFFPSDINLHLFPKAIPIIQTSLGMKLSMGQSDGMTHYTLSHIQTTKMSLEVATTIADILQTIRHPKELFSIQEGQSNTYHLIFQKQM